MSTTVKPPYDIFLDTSGRPLDNGQIYIGEINANPETNPILVYYDRAQTIPAPNPVSTIAGYPARAGSAAALYVSGGYSITVKDKNGVTVFNSPTNSDDSADGQAIQIKNYFANSTFETGTTTGWNLGKDSGTTTPLSGGIGGGATDFLPLSINGSTPLAGGNSLLLNKATGNAQGSTLYTDNMTVELEDVGAEMYIGFSYITPSVGYTTGDLSAFLWDVTGGALVTLSSNSVPGSAGVPGKFTASATLPAGRTTFRFILMFTNAANLAEISIELDSFAFSPYTFADAATTGYVDAAVAAHAALTNPHSATSSATASRLMLRDASGNVSVNQLTSVVTTGTAPLVVASTTLVSNLNAERLNGQLGSYYLPAASYTAADVLSKLLTVDTDTAGINATTLKSITIGQSGASYIPYLDASQNLIINSTGFLAVGSAGVYNATETVIAGRRAQNAKTVIEIDNQGNGASAYSGFRLDSFGSAWDILTGSTLANSNALDFTNGSVRMRITSGGNVLVGTTVDTGVGALKVQNSGSVQIVAMAPSANTAGIGFRPNGSTTDKFQIGTDSTNEFFIYDTTAALERIRVKTDGKIWVNRTTDDGSGAVLQVNGGISGNFLGTFGAISGANLTSLNASNLGSGTVPLARLSGITATEMASGYKFRSVNGGSVSGPTALPAISVGEALIIYYIASATSGAFTLPATGTFSYFFFTSGALSGVEVSQAGGSVIVSVTSGIRYYFSVIRTA